MANLMKIKVIVLEDYVDQDNYNEVMIYFLFYNIINLFLHFNAL